ncbi:Agamous-like MADS-box protein AGL30-like protein [Drosera capensis]
MPSKLNGDDISLLFFRYLCAAAVGHPCAPVCRSDRRRPGEDSWGDCCYYCEYNGLALFLLVVSSMMNLPGCHRRLRHPSVPRRLSRRMSLGPKLLFLSTEISEEIEMVRPRVQLERLEGELSREHFYLQTRSTIIKKAREMSILTASDLLFLSFSPSGVPTICLGDNTDLLNIVTRFSQIAYDDREKRRLDNLQTMRVNYQTDEYIVDVEMLHNGWKYRRLADLHDESIQLKNKLSTLNQRKSLWENPRSVNSIETLREMEKTVLKSIEVVRKRKEELKAAESLRDQDELNAHYEQNMWGMLRNQAPAPEPSYHVPELSYLAPGPSYLTPGPSYHTPGPSYHPPEPSYHAPEPRDQAPEPSYHAPEPRYHTHEPSYHAPEPWNQAPEPSHHTPEPYLYGDDFISEMLRR